MIIQPHWIVFGLAIYSPLEVFLLKWLPVSDLVYTFSRQVGEMVLYSLLLVVVVNRLWQGLSIRKTPIDKLLLTFIALAVASIFLNDAPIIGSLMNMKVFLSYLAVYYLVVNLNLTSRQIQRLVFLSILIAFAESLLAIYQHFIGINSFWLPRDTDTVVGGYQKTFIYYSAWRR
jgi:hypothetical protein